MRTLLAASLGFALCVSTHAFAQEKAAAPKKEQRREPAKPRRVIRAEETQVEGRIQKPQAFYILQRSNLNFDELKKSEDFIPLIEQSVNKEPF